jgi:hypothetical protein
MFTELFRTAHRRHVLVAMIVALSVSPAVTAATPAAHPPKKDAKAPVRPQKKTGQKAGQKPVKASVAPAVPEVVPSPVVTHVAGWIAAAHDNGALPYIIIDKQTASLWLFKANGEPVGETPVLLGMGVGDDSSPGVGSKHLEEIGPAERTTPAGRFIAKFGRAAGNTRVLWVDYANSVALHAVITTNKKEHRVARLLSPTPDDNRISFGCINVGTSFYGKRVRPLFQKAGGIVYILPDSKPLDDVFPRLRLMPYLSGDGTQ